MEEKKIRKDKRKEERREGEDGRCLLEREQKPAASAVADASNAFLF